MQKLYIIHGWTYSLDTWTTICQLLQAEGIEPVQLKVPGLTSPSDKVWDMAGYVEWLDTQLKNDPSPIILGHSNGGRIALNYAISHPGSLKQLILLDSAGVPHATTKKSLVKMAAKVAKPLKHIPGVSKVVYHFLGAQDYNNAPPNMKQTMQNMLSSDGLLDLSKVNVPTTILWGREDTVTPLADGELMQKTIPGAKLHIIDEARHAPHATKPQEVATLILNILKGDQ